MSRNPILFFIFLSGTLLFFCKSVKADKNSIVCFNSETGTEQILRREITDRTENNEITPSHAAETSDDEDIPSFSIIGQDDRDIIYFSPSKFPYTAVVRIETETSYCSGFLIGPHYIATAAHCLYDRTEGWAADVRVCPNYSGGKSPYGCAKASDKMIPEEYYYYADEDYDEGLIRVEENLGSRTGWFGTYAMTDKEAQNKYMMILGYASDKDMEYMFQSNGYTRGTSMDGKRLLYTADTLVGASGSPIVISVDGDWEYIIGIHTAGSFSGGFNSGVRFSRNSIIYDYVGK